MSVSVGWGRSRGTCFVSSVSALAQRQKNRRPYYFPGRFQVVLEIYRKMTQVASKALQRRPHGLFCFHHPAVQAAAGPRSQDTAAGSKEQ